MGSSYKKIQKKIKQRKRWDVPNVLRTVVRKPVPSPDVVTTSAGTGSWLPLGRERPSHPIPILAAVLQFSIPFPHASFYH